MLHVCKKPIEKGLNEIEQNMHENKLKPTAKLWFNIGENGAHIGYKAREQCSPLYYKETQRFIHVEYIYTYSYVYNII